MPLDRTARRHAFPSRPSDDPRQHAVAGRLVGTWPSVILRTVIRPPRLDTRSTISPGGSDAHRGRFYETHPYQREVLIALVRPLSKNEVTRLLQIVEATIPSAGVFSELTKQAILDRAEAIIEELSASPPETGEPSLVSPHRRRWRHDRQAA